MLLLDYLVNQFPEAKKQTLKQMVEAGRVRVNGRPARKLKQEVGEADRIEIADKPRKVVATLDPLKRIHEDADILVVYKPPGLLTSTTPREWRPTAISIIRNYLADTDRSARPGVVHRLDRDASGLLVFSKIDEAYESLKGQFYHHTVDRIYTAVVYGVPIPPKDRIKSNLIEMPDGVVRTTRRPNHGQIAVTDYELLRHNKKYSLLKVTLQTGRKHQIRTHLSQRGHPIVGDEMYFRPEIAEDAGISRMMLVATQLAFDHPRTGQRMEFGIPAPVEMEELLAIPMPRPHAGR